MITVRTGSTRLPNKCMYDLCGETVLSHVILRALKFGFTPVIATTDLPEDSVIDQIAYYYGVPCYRGSVEDKMQRWLSACQQFDIERFAVVDCDDPFFDFTLTRLMYYASLSYDFVMPDMRAYLGSHGMGVAVEALGHVVDANAASNIHSTENVTKFIINEPSVIHTKVEDLHPMEDDLRLTLDYPEDYWLISTVCRELGRYATRTDIVDFFVQNPGLKLVNSFRNFEWKQRQDQQ